MANKVSQRIYWDSSVFLAYFNNEAERKPVLDALLEEVEKSNGQKKIYSSMLAKVEVAFVTYEKRHGNLDPAIAEQIDAFWEDDSVIQLVEFHDEIASSARNLIREGLPKGWGLKPIDSVHLATASWLGVDELHTYDLDHFKKYEPLLELTVCEPYAAQPKLPMPPT